MYVGCLLSVKGKDSRAVLFLFLLTLGGFISQTVFMDVQLLQCNVRHLLMINLALKPSLRFLSMYSCSIHRLIFRIVKDSEAGGRFQFHLPVITLKLIHGSHLFS